MELFLEFYGLSKDEDDFFNEAEIQIDQKDNYTENIEVKEHLQKPKIAILTFKNVTKNDYSVFLSESIIGDLIINFSQ